MRACQQLLLAELGRSALESTDLADLFAPAANLLAAGLGTEYSAIFELQGADGQPSLITATGWTQLLAQQHAAMLLTEAAECTLRSGLPVVVDSWPAETRFQSTSLLDGRRIMSSLRVRISACGRPFGVLAADSAEPHRFGGDYICFAQAVANLLGLAVERQRELAALRQNEQLMRCFVAGSAETNAAHDPVPVITAYQQAVLDERQRLARDLHDSVTQSLYGITLYAEAASRTLAAGNLATVASQLHELQDTAQETLRELRLLLYELHPPLLEKEGLVAALRGRLEAVEGRSRLNTELCVSGEIAVSPVVEQALYRIAQEALNNVLKHAAARRVSVSLSQGRSQISMEIADDGHGFDPAAERLRGGMGLRGISERVQQLRGKLSFLSAPQAGTRVLVEVPV